MQQPPYQQPGEWPTQPPEQPQQPIQQPNYPPPPQPPGYQPNQPGSTAQPPMQPPGSTAQQPGAQYQQTGAPSQGNWITLSALRNRSLVDRSAGTVLGTVHDVLLNPQMDRIEAFTTKGSFLRSGTHVPFRSSTIGADAITYQPGSLEGQDTSWLDTLPQASNILNVPALSENGQALGKVADLRFDQNTGQLVGIEIAPERTGLFSHRGSEQLLPAEGIARIGPDAVIARAGRLQNL
jgi:uncharacterized protein YrrD